MISDKYKYRDYIQDSVINPLERLMGNNRLEDVNLWEKYGTWSPSKDATYKSTLHNMMLPYYDMYLNGSFRLCKPNMESIRWHMKRVIEDDDNFGEWVSHKNLVISAEGWGNNMQRIPESKRIYQYFYILEHILQKDCNKDWNALAKELRDLLFCAEVYCDYKTDEVLCVLHAFTMIMLQPWSKEKKLEQFELLRQNWLFLKHYYSVMIRHIVGVKYTKFYDIAKTVLEKSLSFRPHMHIFYCGLMDCVDELQLDKKHRRNMDKICLQMQDELNKYEPSEILYELCNAIFPEDFQRLLREHRPKSYREVEDESRRKDELIKEMTAQSKHFHDELDKTQELLLQMVLSAIPIEDLDKELMKYPPGTAWDMLKELNANVLISVQPAWREHFPMLLEKHRQRLFEPIDQQKNLTDAIKKVAARPTYGEYNNYESGSVHDDNRQQLSIETREKPYPLKRIVNE